MNVQVVIYIGFGFVMWFLGWLTGYAVGLEKRRK